MYFQHGQHYIAIIKVKSKWGNWVTNLNPGVNETNSKRDNTKRQVIEKAKGLKTEQQLDKGVHGWRSQMEWRQYNKSKERIDMKKANGLKREQQVEKGERWRKQMEWRQYNKSRESREGMKKENGIMTE